MSRQNDDLTNAQSPTPAGQGGATPTAKRRINSLGDVVGRIDPTATAERNIAIKDASDELKSRLQELDIESINCTIDDIGRLASDANDRWQDLQSSLQNALGENTARVDELASTLQSLARDANSKVNDLDLAALNETVDEIRKLAERLNERIAAIDVDAARSIVTNASKLQRQANTVIAQTAELAGDLHEKARSFPTDEINHAIIAVESVAHNADRTLAWARLLLIILIVPAAAITWCAFAVARRARIGDS